MGHVLSGSVIGSRYRLDARLGSGGMAEVWRAHDLNLGRDVALKHLHMADADDPIAVERFRREAVATARISHPNLVAIFDAGVADHEAYIVMELAAGDTLAHTLRQRGPLPVADAVRYATGIASGLAAVHAIGVVHRDVKPSNVMVAASGVKLLDFGIATLVSANAMSLTRASTTIGTAAYMAPEQAMGGAITPATDAYALGCVLMTMLTGRPPFQADDPIAVATQQISAVPPRLSLMRPDVPPDLDVLVSRLLAKDPAARPNDAEILAALHSISRGEPATLPMASAPLLAAAPTAVLPTPVSGPRSLVTPTAPPPPTAYASGSRPGRMVGIMAFIAMVALGLGGFAWWWTSTHPVALPVPSATAKATSPTPTPSPTRTPSPTPTKRPTSASPSAVPSVSASTPGPDALLGAAVDSVTNALNTWTPAGADETAAKASLLDQWSKASPKILAGQNAQKFYNDFSASLDKTRSDGGIPLITYFSVKTSLSAVGLLL